MLASQSESIGKIARRLETIERDQQVFEAAPSSIETVMRGVGTSKEMRLRILRRRHSR